MKVNDDIQNQVDIFNIFHDGDLANIEKSFDNIVFMVNIPYLAKLLKPGCTFFRGKMESIKFFFFEFWGDVPRTTHNISYINSLQLEILGAEVNNNLVEVSCRSNRIQDYSGGVLKFEAKRILIYDEESNPISLNKLEQLCRQYWNNIN